MEDDLAKMEFTKDQDGNELLLKDGKFQVMMEWEKPYMQACVNALQPKGNVLEIGFGCGYASTYIQEHNPTSHTIIEYHPVVAAKAREWAKNYKNIRIVQDTWQNALPTLGKFDAIFFDDYPLESEQQMDEKKKHISVGNEALAQGKAVIEDAHNAIPSLKTKTYSEEDIEEFFTLVDPKSTPKELIHFFHELKRDKHITSALLDASLQKLIDQKRITPDDLKQYKEETSSRKEVFQHQGDRLFTFIDLCMKNHMNKGAVFSCYLEDPSSKFFDKKFFDHIITNPFVDYHEEWISIEVPKHCKYYKGNEALVIRITLF